MTIDELLSQLDEIVAIFGQERVVVIGGAAVQLRTRTSSTAILTADGRLDAAALAAVPRNTQDIDVCTPDPRLARRRLIDAGFVQDGHRFTRGDLNIDLPRELPYSGLALAPGRASVPPIPGVAIEVGEILTLVVCKANANATRGEDRDLVDLARLALILLHDETAADELAMLLAEERQLGHLIDLFRLAFASPTARGPDAYIAALRADPTRAHALVEEQAIREFLVLAVKRLLIACPPLDEDAL